MTDPLAQLFSTSTRVKLLRLFLFNPGYSFTVPQAAERARVSAREARREIAVLLRAKLVQRSRRSRAWRFVLRNDFKYLQALQALMLNSPIRGEDIVKQLRPAGGLKFLTLGGIFLGHWDSALDILAVGDRVSDAKFRARIRRLEAEVGKELRYALLTTSDFSYRLAMSDKLLRDVLDYPHRIVVDRLNTGLK